MDSHVHATLHRQFRRYPGRGLSHERRSQRRRGAAVVEFALVASVMLLAISAALSGVTPTGKRTPASISSAATSGIKIIPMCALVE